MPLTLLNVDGTDVTDLGPLQGMALAWLELAGTPVVDLGPLAGMPLEFLVLADTGVTDISVLRDMPLKTAILFRTKITDFSPLRNCPLVNLRFPYQAERDAALVRSIKTLREINLLPAAEFLIQHPLPWQGLFDGKSIEKLDPRPDKGWKLDRGVLTSAGADCVLLTREEFEDGEFRIQFRAQGINFLSLQVRHLAERGYAAVPDVAHVNPPPGGKPALHEVIFTCLEDQVSATFDGQPVPLKYRNGPRRGPLQVRVMGGHLSLISIDRR
jgi:hypothetical protein